MLPLPSLPSSSPVSFAWGTGDELVIYGGTNVLQARFETALIPPQDVLEIGRSSFAALQHQQQHHHQPNTLLETSRKLRLAHCNAFGPEPTSAWWVCEIIHLKPLNTLLRMAMLEWAHQTYPIAPGSEPWQQVELAVLKGDTKQAASLLRSSATGNFSWAGRTDGEFIRALQTTCTLLDDAQFLDVARWMTWKQTVIDARREQPLELNLSTTSTSSLSNICAMLQGDLSALTATLVRHSGRGAKWPHLLSAVLLFQSPTLQSNQLGVLAETCALRWNNPVVRESVIAACKGDVMLTLQLMRGEMGDKFLEAHMAEVFARAGAYECPSLSKTVSKASVAATLGSSAAFAIVKTSELDMREMAITRYACSIAFQRRRGENETSSLCRIASEYLSALRRIRTSKSRKGASSSASVGRFWMELVLEMTEPEHDNEAQVLFDAAIEMSFPELAVNLALQRAEKHRCHGGESIIRALEWCEKADKVGMSDSKHTARFVRRMLAPLTTSTWHDDFTSTMEQIRQLVHGDAIEYIQQSGVMWDKHIPGASTLLVRVSKVLGYIAGAREQLRLGKPEWVGMRDWAMKELSDLCEDPTCNRLLSASFLVMMLKDVLLFEMQQDRVQRAPPRLTLGQTLIFVNALEMAELAGRNEGFSDNVVVSMNDLRAILGMSVAGSVACGRWKRQEVIG